MARVLEAKNVPVALLVTLAPYRQDPVPANVMRAINYYQSGGWGAPLTAGPLLPAHVAHLNLARVPPHSHHHHDQTPPPTPARPPGPPAGVARQSHGAADAV